MMRAPSVSASDLKRGAWSIEEDFKLVDYVTRYGCRNWQLLPKFAGLARSGKSCRQRWVNYLRPGIKREAFSKEEEAAIIRFHRDLGNRWSAIAARLPGRTDAEIKNLWHTRLKQKLHMLPANELEPSDDVISYTVDQPISGLNLGLHARHVGIENESESSSTVGNSGVIGRNSSDADQPQCSVDRDSDFTDVNAFKRILKRL